MSERRPTYLEVLETNWHMAMNGDETYWLCVTRTVQGSKLFPISPYIMLSYVNAFYRYNEVMRKIETYMTAEELGDRARTVGLKTNPLSLWGMANFYLLGREWLIAMGFLRPQDAAEDVMYVLDFWKRFQLAYKRNTGYLTNRSANLRCQTLPDRTLEIFKNDMFECTPGDELHHAAHGFLAAASQYTFLASAECRIGLNNNGPYKLDGGREMLVRDFMDLSESSLPWLDDVAAGVSHNNLTVSLAVQDCHFYLVDDWSSFESKPEFTPDKLVGVGLYTSDALSEGFEPVAMESREALTAKFIELTEEIKVATTKLWERMASWNRDQLVDAGAIVYYAVFKDLAHLAGCFEVEDWLEIDPRAERFRPLLNDEFGNLVLGELLTGGFPTQKASPFTMMPHSNAPVRIFTPIPTTICDGEDYVPSVAPMQKGGTHLDAKIDRYKTTKGTLSLADYNKAARANKPEQLGDRYLHLCETWVKYNADSPLANEMYKAEQRTSRTMKNKGTGEGETSRD